jgi:hypothetical protein
LPCSSLLALNSHSSCFRLLSVGIIGMDYCIWLFFKTPVLCTFLFSRNILRSQECPLSSKKKQKDCKNHQNSIYNNTKILIMYEFLLTR